MKNQGNGLRITGIGYYLPPQVETAADLSLKIGRSQQWIERRTGVIERRISAVDVDVMGAEAGRMALGDGPPPDLIINASAVGKQALPDTSVFIQRELGFEGIPSFTIHATCLSFLVALKTAASFIVTEAFQRILIISTDRGSRGRNLKEPESAALLGDAAAAVVVESPRKGENSKLICWKMQTFPEGAELTQLRGGGTHLPPHDPLMKMEDNLFTMQGPRVYKMARQQVYTLIQELMQAQNLDRSDIDLVIPHQTSGYGVQAYVKYGGFAQNQVVDIVGRTGNCVAASIPLALALAHEEGRFQRNDLLLLIGTGAGLSIAAALLRF